MLIWLVYWKFSFINFYFKEKFEWDRDDNNVTRIKLQLGKIEFRIMFFIPTIKILFY